MEEKEMGRRKKPLYKRWWFWLLAVLAVLILFVSFGGNSDHPDRSAASADKSNQSDRSNKSQSQKMQFTQENLDILIGDPKKYKGSGVEFTGRVFTEPEKDEKGTYLQMFADPENSEKNMMVQVGDPKLEAKNDSYIKVKGTVLDEMTGTNAFGAVLTAPVIKADTAEVVDYITAVSPAKKTVEVNNTIEQHGLKITLEKAELAEKETRLYIKAKNDSQNNADILTYSAKLIQGSKQLEEETNFDADYPELQNEVLPGVETEGILAFSAVNPDQDMKFLIEGSSDDYTLEFKPYEFQVGIEE